MSAYACICGPMSIRCRSSETNYQCGYRHKCIYGCLTAKKVGLVVIAAAVFCLFLFLCVYVCVLFVCLFVF